MRRARATPPARGRPRTTTTSPEVVGLPSRAPAATASTGAPAHAPAESTEPLLVRSTRRPPPTSVATASPRATASTRSTVGGVGRMAARSSQPAHGAPGERRAVPPRRAARVGRVEVERRARRGGRRRRAAGRPGGRARRRRRARRCRRAAAAARGGPGCAGRQGRRSSGRRTGVEPERRTERPGLGPAQAEERPAPRRRMPASPSRPAPRSRLSSTVSAWSSAVWPVSTPAGSTA